MFDSFLKSKFYSKCKSDVKMTKVRIEMIKRKRKAMVKFLRKDIADLLKNDLDYNAYCRVEGLYVEQNMSSCYDFIVQSCVVISSHLSGMNKQKECPDECKEAIASLMFAAARFADLPELRELRRLFSERYGNSLELFVSKEFAKKLKAEPPTKEMKLQLMQKIALECGFEWDSKALEQQLYRPPPSAQDWTPNANEDADNELQENRHQSGWGNKFEGARAKSEHRVDQTEVENRKETVHPRGRPLCSNPISEGTNRENVAPHEERERATLNISGGRKFFGFRSMAPPYVKTDSSRTETSMDTSPSTSGTEEAGAAGRKLTADENHQSHEKPAKPVPRSVRRRRPLKPPPGHNEENNASSTSPKVSKGDIRDQDQRDEEERRIDKLLDHYSRKPSKSTHDPSTLEVESPRRRGGAGAPRATSLPPEALTSPKATGSRPGHTRTGSYQQDSSSTPPLGHVHPKLPDYDDFLARLATLRANSK